MPPVSFPPLSTSSVGGEKLVSSQKTGDFSKVATEFEASFIAEMLSHAGLAKALSSEAGFGGEAMSGMLLREYATMIADRGGFGIAEAITRQLTGSADDAK